MPKDKASFKSKFPEWIKKLPRDEQGNFDKTGDELVFCKVCSKTFKCGKKFQLDQHVSTPLHKSSVQRSQGYRQSRITDEKPQDTFNAELCDALLAADIPFYKLENPNFKEFLTKYCNRPIPHSTTLRNKHVENRYNAVIEKIRSELKESTIWLSIDETTDRCGRFVANVLVGRLSGEKETPRLLMSRELSETNNLTVTQLALDALHFLWPGKMEAEISQQFAVFLSDGAPYMVKAGKTLKRNYPKLLHITCLAHAFNRVAETVRSSFSDVDKLLSSVKAVFKKSPSRLRKYHEKLPGLQLPPEPVLTRWGTWLEAAEFMCKNFEGVRSVVDLFDENDAESIKKAQHYFHSVKVPDQLAEISANYVFLSKAIKKLETRNLLLTEGIGILADVQNTLNSNISPIGIKIKAKLKEVIAKNPDIDKIQAISDVLSGTSTEATNLSPSYISKLKYCPVTSVELERSFSMEKALLSDRRCSFTMKNIEMYIVSHFDSSVCEKSD